MAIDLAVVKGDYWRDLLSQPAALEATLEQLDESAALRALASRLQKGKFRTVVLTGMGSSYHGLNPLLLQLIEARHSAVLVETSELIYYSRRLLDPGSLIVAVSQSGRSAEIVRLLDENRGRAPIIAVTNTADSPLARRADAVILTRAGAEFSVSCKTYVSALLALKFLGDQLVRAPFARTRRELTAAVRPAARYLARWQEHVEFMLPGLAGVRQLYLAGRGPSLAAVGTGALILKESTHFPAEGLSSAAFRHGPFEMLGPETFVLILAGNAGTRELNRRLFRDIRARGGRAELVAQGSKSSAYSLPKVPSGILPILEILPIQMGTLALAAMVGRQPGQFRFGSKITATE